MGRKLKIDVRDCFARESSEMVLSALLCNLIFGTLK